MKQSKYKLNMRYLNMSMGQFNADPVYGVPYLEPYTEDVPKDIQMVGFNFAMSTPKEKLQDKLCHFYLDDYQFDRVWNYPDRYIEPLQKFKAVLTPDFSIYADFPVVQQMWNHYRKHVVGAWWHSKGLKVIPTIGWSDKLSYDWCFVGEPKNSVVSVSSVGVTRDKHALMLFVDGWDAMMEAIRPKKVIFYGEIMDEILTRNDLPDIIPVRSFRPCK